MHECKFCDESEKEYCVRCECRYYSCKKLIEYLQRKSEGKSTKYCNLLYCLDHSGCEYWEEKYAYENYIRSFRREKRIKEKQMEEKY
jgi:hypothetical protein